MECLEDEIDFDVSSFLLYFPSPLHMDLEPSPGCAVVFSEKNYEGEELEICQSTSHLPFLAKSVQLGMDISLDMIEENNEVFEVFRDSNEFIKEVDWSIDPVDSIVSGIDVFEDDPNCIYLFTEPDFEGIREEFCQDEYWIPIRTNLDLDNTKFYQSVKVGSLVRQVSLYNDWDWTGPSQTLLGGDWEAKISFTDNGNCKLDRAMYFRAGETYKLGEGVYSLEIDSSYSAPYSTPQKYCVDVYSEKDFQGKRSSFCIGEDWYDKDFQSLGVEVCSNIDIKGFFDHISKENHISVVKKTVRDYDSRKGNFWFLKQIPTYEELKKDISLSSIPPDDLCVKIFPLTRFRGPGRIVCGKEGRNTRREFSDFDMVRKIESVKVIGDSQFTIEEEPMYGTIPNYVGNLGESNDISEFSSKDSGRGVTITLDKKDTYISVRS